MDSADTIQTPKHPIVEVVAASIEEGIAVGAAAMGVDASFVQAEVIEEKLGFMGMGKSKLRVRVRFEPSKVEPKKPRVDGRFLVGCRDGAFYLVVTEPRNDGKPVDPADVERVMTGLPVPEEAKSRWESEAAKPSGLALNLFTGSLSEAFDDEEESADEPDPAGGEAVAPTEADGDPGADDQDWGQTDVGSAAVVISQDRMMAWIASRTMSFTDPLTADDATMAIEESGVTHGMNDVLIERVVGKPLLRPVQIAQGVEPILSIDGEVIFGTNFSEEDLSQFRPDSGPENAPAEGDEDGVEEQDVASDDEGEPVDWFAQFSKRTVDQGEVLAEAVPPVPGSSGTNVLGEEVPVAEGVPVELDALSGENTEVADGKVVALIGGEPGAVDGKLVVHELTGYPKDIDFRTGNVRFPGSVHVKGTVKSGFVVSARDNVEVGAGVEAADVSAAGSILIGGGFLGDADGRTGSLMAGRELTVKFVEGGSIAVGGDMLIGGDIVRGNVAVLGKLKLEGGGRIIGGRVAAGVEIQAKTIGSPGGARTVVSVGNPSTEEKTVKKLVEARALATMTDEDEEGDDADDEIANATPSDSDQTSHPVDNNGDQQVEGDAEEPLRGPRILIRDAVYPGAVIGIGHSVRIIDTRIDHCILREVDDEIRIFPL